MLLVIAYTASSLPTNARVLVGVVFQLQPSLKDAARTHGAGELVAWARTARTARPGRRRTGRAPRAGRRWTKGYLTVTHCSPFIPSSAA
jgi:hypothetical protein